MSEEKKTKPGYKSTEFYITVGAMVAGALLASGAFADSQWVQLVGAIAAAIAPVAYNQGRAVVKKGTKEK